MGAKEKEQEKETTDACNSSESDLIRKSNFVLWQITLSLYFM